MDSNFTASLEPLGLGLAHAGLAEAVFANPLVAFILLVGAVILVHELGHFLMGRLLGIGVEEFSIGFGPTAWSKKVRGTVYKICWLPIGGYVRFWGADATEDIPPEQRASALNLAPVYKRSLISIAGPAANFVLSSFVMIGLYAVGFPQAATVVTVLPGSAAQQAGLMSGDRIVELDGHKIETWKDLNTFISPRANTSVVVEVERTQWFPGNPRPESTAQVVLEPRLQRLKFVVTPRSDDGESPYGEKVKVGRLGVTQFMLSATLAPQAQDPLWTAGFRPNDQVLRVGSVDVRYAFEFWGVLSSHFLTAPRSSVEVFVSRVSHESPSLPAQQVSVQVTAEHWAEFLARGQGPSTSPTSDLTLAFASQDTPPQKQRTAWEAWRACGLSPGVTLRRLNGTPLGHPLVLMQLLQKFPKPQDSPGVSVPQTPHVNFEFDVSLAQGELKKLSCSIPLRAARNALNRHDWVVDFPFRFHKQGEPTPWVQVKSSPWWMSIRHGLGAAGEQMASIGAALLKLVTGGLPVSSLGGPLAIAKVAGDAAEGGLVTFLLTVSLMSINIGLFNLLPLPALDGGHLLLQAVEAAYGKPLPNRVQELIQKLGIIIILTLVVIVFYNDIIRLFSGS